MTEIHNQNHWKECGFSSKNKYKIEKKQKISFDKRNQNRDICLQRHAFDIKSKAIQAMNSSKHIGFCMRPL